MYIYIYIYIYICIHIYIYLYYHLPRDSHHRGLRSGQNTAGGGGGTLGVWSGGAVQAVSLRPAGKAERRRPELWLCGLRP